MMIPLSQEFLAAMLVAQALGFAAYSINKHIAFEVLKSRVRVVEEWGRTSTADDKEIKAKLDQVIIQQTRLETKFESFVSKEHEH